MSTYSVPRESSLLLHALSTDTRLRTPLGVLQIADRVPFTGADEPIFPIPWRFAEAVSACKGLEGAWGSFIASQRHGTPPEQVTVDVEHAQLFLMGGVIWSLDGKGPSDPATVEKLGGPDSMFGTGSSDPYRQLATNVYKTKDGRFYHIHGSLNPSPVQDFLSVPHSRPDLKDTPSRTAAYVEAVSKWNAVDLDYQSNSVYKQAGTICYTVDEFLALPQGEAIKDCPLYELYPSGASSSHAPCGWPKVESGSLPLAGIKVLDLTRIIAAPSISRTLSEYGATVLRITSPNLPDAHVLNPELGQGKLNAYLDLRTEEGRQRLQELIKEADVFIDGYRPGSLEKLGFGRDAVDKLIEGRPRGIVYVRENCYGWHGPWVSRSGWQQIADCVTGVSWGFGLKQGLDEPVVPIIPNSDYGTGVVGAIGVMHALWMRSVEGGSPRLDVALAYYNLFVISAGFYSDEVWKKIQEPIASRPLRHYETMPIMLVKVIPPLLGRKPHLVRRPDFYVECDAPSYGGRIRAVAPVVRLENMKLGHVRPPSKNGTDKPEWPKDGVSDLWARD